MSTKYEELKSLRIDDHERGDHPSEPKWSKRYIIIGIVILVVLSLGTLVVRALQGSVPVVETTRATIESSAVGGTVLNATGYIVAHHKINVNSKVTGRVAWIGVEKGDKVKQGQILVRLEDDEFRAAVEQGRGAVRMAEGHLKELENGSRPEEVSRAEHDLEEARATLANDRSNVERARGLARDGVFSRQQLDDAQARFEASQHRVTSIENTYKLAKLGPRA